MSQSECCDPKIGVLLHAYEVGSLSDENTQRFEIHMLRCERCHSEIALFESQSELLRQDKVVRHEAALEASSATDESARIGGIWKSLWPDKSRVLQPAWLIIAIILLIYPAYLGLRTSDPQEVAPLQVIALVPTRSAVRMHFQLDQTEEVAISFVYVGAKEDHSYEIILREASGDVIYSNSNFTSFNEWGTGHLFMPAGTMKSGNYIIVIKDPLGEVGANIQEYRFPVTVQ